MRRRRRKRTGWRKRMMTRMEPGMRKRTEFGPEDEEEDGRGWCSEEEDEEDGAWMMMANEVQSE